MSGARSLLVMAAGALVLTGCMESIGQPLPLQEAQWAEWGYPAYEMTPTAAEDPAGPGRRVQVDGRTWVGFDAADRFYGAGFGVRIPADRLRPIGSSDGVALYALTHDAPPYGRLYSPLGPGRWRVYTSITH